MPVNQGFFEIINHFGGKLPNYGGMIMKNILVGNGINIQYDNENYTCKNIVLRVIWVNYF